MGFPTDHLNDKELIARYKRTGELELVAQLFDRYMPLIYGVCLKYLKNREESRDATMQLFEKLAETLNNHAIEHFKSWLYATTRNHCLMILRASKGKNFVEISDIHMETEVVLHPFEEPMLERNLIKLERCIDQLAGEQKQCVRLFYLKKKCYNEICTETGYEMNQVKSYIQNGKRNLKICMEKHV